MPKQLHVNLFEMNTVSHFRHGLWSLEGNNRHRFNDIEFWTEMAQIAEHGTLDSIFIADVFGIYDHFRRSPEPALRLGMQVPTNDPLLVVPAMAAVTKGLGFGVTFSTTYEPPFAFARRMSTLDHLTNGRMAWNIVTSYLESAARNFGLTDEIPHDHRYEIADEYLDVLYKLWEGSWDDDAVIMDAERNIYTDPAKVRAIDHVGEYFRVAGPHLSQPSRQRTPVLIQATGSPAGIAFAGRHAEVVFTNGSTLEKVRKTMTDVRASLAANGRDPADVKFITLATVIVGRNDIEVADKVETYKRLTSPEAILTHVMVGIDLLAYPRSERIGDIIERKDPHWESIPTFCRPEQTVGEVIDKLVSMFNDTLHYVAGTPDVVVTEIERWLDEDGIDGINLIQYHSFDTLRDFVELVVPELRRRGRYREAYEPGETLRERLFGAGRARLPSSHFGARYRDPAMLSAPAERLKLSDYGNVTSITQKVTKS